MSNRHFTNQEFLDLWSKFGSPELISKATGVPIRAVYNTRTRVEHQLGTVLVVTSDVNRKSERKPVKLPTYGHRRLMDIKGGIAVIFSDAHFWPGERPVAFDAMIKFIDKNKADIKLVVCNGDAFDGAKISRHSPAQWQHLPDVADELDACKERLGEIEALVPDNIPLVWCMGNHDSRFSARLAQMAPEFVRVFGVDLPHHFPAWDHCWSLEINGHTMVKHRWHNGIHATWNNALKGGRNIFTGHLHRLMVTPMTDYNGRRYGVDTGTLSDFGPDVEKFNYAEDNAFNWASGFAVATFDNNGMLLPPELVTVINGVAYWRGKPI
jgi:hypothetical protein